MIAITLQGELFRIALSTNRAIKDKWKPLGLNSANKIVISNKYIKSYIKKIPLKVLFWHLNRENCSMVPDQEEYKNTDKNIAITIAIPKHFTTSTLCLSWLCTPEYTWCRIVPSNHYWNHRSWHQKPRHKPLTQNPGLREELKQ